MNKKQLVIELAMPVLFALLSVYVILKAIPMKGEGVFPIMAAAVLLICSVYLFAEAFVKKEAVVQLKDLNLLMVAATFVILLVYVALLKMIGYAVSTFLLCTFIIRSLGYRRMGFTILCSVLTVAATFVIFKILLSVPLPTIFLNF